jgi:hypothetical protein
VRFCSLLFPFALGETEANLFARSLVFPIYILDEFLQVGRSLFGHFRFLFVFFARHGFDYSICSGVRPGESYPLAGSINGVLKGLAPLNYL